VENDARLLHLQARFCLLVLRNFLYRFAQLQPFWLEHDWLFSKKQYIIGRYAHISGGHDEY
jgi:hypothetical protein